jgi:hypothetical protein
MSLKQIRQLKKLRKLNTEADKIYSCSKENDTLELSSRKDLSLKKLQQVFSD